ncbi:MAG: PilN domain-containing protein [Candidatus Omnitrophica bacterium]|nr:PilN domain-containing protein [Candidatus Omnitrophota bacterium]
MKTKLNLLPKDLIKKERKEQERLNLNQFKIIIVIFILLLSWKSLAFGILLKIKSTTNRKTKEIVKLDQKIATLKMSAEAELKTKEDKLNLLKDQLAIKEEEVKNLEPIRQLISQKEKFVYNLLKAIADYIPEEVWLEEFGFEREENNCFLKGCGLSHNKIAVFLSKINQLPYFKELYLKQSERIFDEKFEKDIVRFEIIGKLNL